MPRFLVCSRFNRFNANRRSVVGKPIHFRALIVARRLEPAVILLHRFQYGQLRRAGRELGPHRARCRMRPLPWELVLGNCSRLTHYGNCQHR